MEICISYLILVLSDEVHSEDGGFILDEVDLADGLTGAIAEEKEIEAV